MSFKEVFFAKFCNSLLQQNSPAARDCRWQVLLFDLKTRLRGLFETRPLHAHFVWGEDFKDGPSKVFSREDVLKEPVFLLGVSLCAKETS